MKFIRYIFPVLCIGIMALFSALYILDISPQCALAGVTIQNEKPERNVGDVMSGKYQTQYANWFGDNFPFRSYLVRGYNQVGFAIGSEVNGVKRGKEGNLFGKTFTTESLMGNLDDTLIENYVENLSVIQQKLSEQGKVFVYMITPSKAEIYEEDLPWNYLKAAEVTKNKADIRLKMVKYLKEYNIKYIDFTELMFKLKEESQYSLFYKSGIHWSQYAVSQSLIELFSYIEKEYNIDLPEIQFTYEEIAAAEFDEKDYSNLLNLVKDKITDTYYTANLTCEQDPSKMRNVFSMSTSFTFSYINLFRKGEIPFKYYWRSQYTQFQDKLYPGDTGTVWESWLPGVPVNDMNMQEIVNYLDILMIENNACELLQSHIDFVQSLANYLSE